jgi:hypothetical protein
VPAISSSHEKHKNRKIVYRSAWAEKQDHVSKIRGEKSAGYMAEMTEHLLNKCKSLN